MLNKLKSVLTTLFFIGLLLFITYLVFQIKELLSLNSDNKTLIESFASDTLSEIDLSPQTKVEKAESFYEITHKLQNMSMPIKVTYSFSNGAELTGVYAPQGNSHALYGMVGNPDTSFKSISVQPYQSTNLLVSLGYTLYNSDKCSIKEADGKQSTYSGKLVIPDFTKLKFNPKNDTLVLKDYHSIQEWFSKVFLTDNVDNEKLDNGIIYITNGKALSISFSDGINTKSRNVFTFEPIDVNFAYTDDYVYSPSDIEDVIARSKSIALGPRLVYCNFSKSLKKASDFIDKTNVALRISLTNRLDNTKVILTGVRQLSKSGDFLVLREDKTDSDSVRNNIININQEGDSVVILNGSSNHIISENTSIMPDLSNIKDLKFDKTGCAVLSQKQLAAVLGYCYLPLDFVPDKNATAKLYLVAKNDRITGVEVNYMSDNIDLDYVIYTEVQGVKFDNVSGYVYPDGYPFE